MQNKCFAFVFTMSLALSGPAMALSTAVVDRGLPDSNLNNVSGSNRSNVAWAYGGSYQTGDTFTLPSTGNPANTDWRIDSLTGWFTAGAPGDSSFSLGDRYKDVSLFLGPTGGTTISKVASSTITGNAADAPNVTISPVTYTNGENYQGSGGASIQIWEITFSNLGIYTPGEYAFSIAATVESGFYWFNHASNAAKGGVTADGADNLYRWLFGDATDSSLSIGGSVDSNGNGWDKSSDINVLVNASIVPVPAALPLLASAVAAFAMFRRRARRA